MPHAPLASEIAVEKRQATLEHLLALVQSQRKGPRAAPRSPAAATSSRPVQAPAAAPAPPVARAAPAASPSAAVIARVVTTKRPLETPANWSALDRKGRLEALLDRVQTARKRPRRSTR